MILKNRPCKVEGCHNRSQASLLLPHYPYCSGHRKRIRQFGHITGRTIFPGEYKELETLSRRFLKANREHPATIVALEIMARILEPGQEPIWNDRSRRWQRWRELNRLRKDGIIAERALVRLLGIYCFNEERPAILAVGEKFKFAVARSILTLAPAEVTKAMWNDEEQCSIVKIRTPGSLACQEVGRSIMKNLGAYLLAAARSILENEQIRRTTKNPLTEALRQKEFSA